MEAASTASGVAAPRSKAAVTRPWCSARIRSLNASSSGISEVISTRAMPDAVHAFVLEEAARFRRMARGYALGSGNSIPGYVPPEGYLAMLRAGEELRRRESPA